MISPRARLKAKSFVNENLKKLGFAPAVLRKFEREMARAFQDYRNDIAKFVGSSWGTKQWNDTSQAIEIRIRKLM